MMIVYAKTREHSPEQVEKIVASIERYGWTNPILLDEDGEVIAGHGRILAAEKSVMTRCQRSPCLVYRMQKKAYRIADNKLPLGAGWDLELLATELNDLLADEFDLSLTGFDSDEDRSNVECRFCAR